MKKVGRRQEAGGRKIIIVRNLEVREREEGRRQEAGGRRQKAER